MERSRRDYDEYTVADAAFLNGLKENGIRGEKLSCDFKRLFKLSDKIKKVDDEDFIQAGARKQNPEKMSVSVSDAAAQIKQFSNLKRYSKKPEKIWEMEERHRERKKSSKK